MTISNSKTYQEAASADKISFLKNQTQGFLTTITSIENSFKRRFASTEEAKAHACALLMQIGTGTFNIPKKDQSAEEIAALSLFNSPQNPINFTDYTAQTNYLAPQLAVCLYLLDCLNDNKCVSHLEKLKLIPRNVDQSTIKSSIQQITNLLGLTIAFNTLDKPIHYTKPTFFLAMFFGSVFVGSVVAGLILMNPLFLIPVVASIILVAKFAAVSEHCEKQFTDYKDSLSEAYAAEPIKKYANVKIENSSIFEFFAVKTFEDVNKNSEQFSHIEVISLVP